MAPSKRSRKIAAALDAQRDEVMAELFEHPVIRRVDQAISMGWRDALRDVCTGTRVFIGRNALRGEDQRIWLLLAGQVSEPGAAILSLGLQIRRELIEFLMRLPKEKAARLAA